MTSRERRPLLLLGASGFLGSALQQVLGAHVAIATHFTNPRGQSVFFDARSSRLADALLNLSEKPAAAVILFSVTRIDDCARDPKGTAEVNVHSTIRVIDELCELGIMPVFVSSDAVFDGSRSWWREEDAPRPVLTYGRQKLQVEEHLAKSPHPWLAVRLPKLLSDRCDPRCMLTGWVRSLEREGRILCATDQYFTPVSVSDAAHAIAGLIAARLQGLFHVGGPERLSRRALLDLVMEEYGKSHAIRAEIQNCRLGDLPFAEARPRDTSLCSDRIAGHLGIVFRDMGQVVQHAVQACLKAEGK